MITDAMLVAAARALYETTATYKQRHITYDLLPKAVQTEVLKMARVTLEAGLAAAPMPES
jgi:hypothetical protein